MKTATLNRHLLEFIRPGGTSRGVLKTKETYILTVFEGQKKGVGECAVFRGLSSDDVPEYEAKLQWLTENINADFSFLQDQLRSFPSIWCGLEQAFLQLQLGGDLYFENDFSAGKSSIKINGLIWMGDEDFMTSQIEEKLEKGFDCIKIKIGINWPTEREILKKLRQKFPKNELELRVDANGGFNFCEAKTVLQELADLEIHSIEQPIKAGNTEEMALLCEKTPVPIALDEELIGVVDVDQKFNLLNKIKPQYLILKPSLAGGFSGSDEWISAAETLNIGWWITSALESNIGLNAIAQYTFSKNVKMPQGLGTGALFKNNFENRLFLNGDQLWHQ